MNGQVTDVLKKVSRSFFVSLRLLPASVRPMVSLGYLLCRAADTITDTDIAPAATRRELLTQFRDVFSRFPTDAVQVRALAQTLTADTASVSPADRELMAILPEAAAAVRARSRTDQALIRDVVVAVTQGMEMDLTVFDGEGSGIRMLPDHAALERYIGLIGGEPGRFWTRTLIAHEPALRRSDRDALLADGVRFGTGLQLVNILRDLPSDLKRNRCYLPETLLGPSHLRPEDLTNELRRMEVLRLYHAAIDETLDRLQNGVAFLRRLPRWMVRHRMTVWLPLAIALKTLGRLKRLENPARDAGHVKVPRREVYALHATAPWESTVDGLLVRKAEMWTEKARSGYPILS